MKLYQEIKDYVAITLGLTLYSIAVTYFLLPYQLTTGGITGVSSIIYYATGFEVQNSYLIINAIFLLAAVKVLGFKFCVKTIYAVLSMTFILWVLQRLAEDPVTGELPKLVGDQTFMACVIGAILEGMGLAICFASNGSTGGTDIIAAIVNKYKPISLGQVIMLCDIIIISSCYFVFHDYQRVIFGFALLIMSSATLDYVMSRNRQSVQLMIYSRNYRKIADAINSTGRGVTVLNGTGWYTKTERNVIVVLVRRRESVNILRMIKSIDPYAFISMANVAGVYGEGFDELKAKKEKSTKPTLVFASNNAHKLEEIRSILGEKFEIRSLEDIGCHTDIPETAGTLQGNALQKAEYIKQFYGYDCFADDTGLECTALNGEPGVFSARYAGGNGHDSEANMTKLLQNLEDKEDRSAQFRTVIALIYKGETHCFEGVVKGTITKERSGSAGFGYDPIFKPEGYDKTFAELGSDIKNTISHRALAVEKLADFLK